MVQVLPTRRSTKAAVSAVLGLSLLTLTACASSTTRNPATAEGGGTLLRSRVAQAPPQDATDLKAATAGLRKLGLTLSQNLDPDTGAGGNQVFSPASLAIAFAMVREGSDDVTSREIDHVIGLPANRQAAYNRIVQALTDVGAGDTLEINDAFFVDPDLEVKQGYLDAIQKWYGAGVRQTAFPSPALDVINGWVDGKTHGRIPKLLDQLDENAVAALVNTIYLNAKWAEPFDKSETHDQAFTTGAGQAVTTKTMHQSTVLDYAAGDGWQAVRLPYAGGKLSMWVLLPKEGSRDPRDLLAPDVLTEAVDRADPTDVDLSLPRWDTGTRADLTAMLQQRMPHVFEDGHLDRMSPDQWLTVSQVVQQANITVGEKWTEAAAATAVVMAETSAQLPTGLPFTADHPFAYAIVHDETGVPLFEGVVSDPSAG